LAGVAIAMNHTHAKLCESAQHRAGLVLTQPLIIFGRTPGDGALGSRASSRHRKDNADSEARLFFYFLTFLFVILHLSFLMRLALHLGVFA
jgi:hypothetical protein